VYAVVDAGVTARLPDKATPPISGCMPTEVAPVTFQVSVADCPNVIMDGLAVKLVITGIDALATPPEG